MILTYNRIIIAIREQIFIPCCAIGSRGDQVYRIRVDESPSFGVIVPAAEVVQPRLRVIDIPAVAEGVEFAQCVGHGAGGGQRIAPRIVGIRHHLRAATLTEVYHAEFTRHTSVDRIDSRY